MPHLTLLMAPTIERTAAPARPMMHNSSITMTVMSLDHAPRRRQKAPPPGETGQEALYLRSLSERQVAVNVKLRDGEVVSGWIEYFDDRMIRLTREGKPNLFIYKNQIRTIAEQGKGPRRSARGNGGAEAAGEDQR
jgi:host factor-I protein